MAFGEAVPNPWSGYQYTAEVTHTTLLGTITCTLRSDNPDYEGQFDQHFQAFLDLVAASPDFAVANASKSCPTAQAITVTPPEEPE